MEKPTWEERDVVWVASEQVTVVLDPLDGHPLVQEAGVALDPVVTQIQEPKGRDPVLQRGHDDVVLRGQRTWVVDVQGGGPAVVGATVDPDLKRKT